MVSIIGNMKIVNVGPSSTVLVGNTGVIDSYSGANSFTTGDTIGVNTTNNQASSTNTFDPDLIDSPNA